MSRESDFIAGRKDDGADGNGERKPRWSLVPWSAMAAVVRVLEFGAARYGDENWRHVDNGRTRYWDAAMRHLIAWKSGESVDSQTGESHLAHAAADVLFLLVLDQEKP